MSICPTGSHPSIAPRASRPSLSTESRSTRLEWRGIDLLNRRGDETMVRDDDDDDDDDVKDDR